MINAIFIITSTIKFLINVIFIITSTIKNFKLTYSKGHNHEIQIQVQIPSSQKTRVSLYS